MSDLEIPAAALNAYEQAGSYRHALKIADPLIRAAELRYQADVFDPGNAEGPEAEEARHIVSCLRVRANDLDPR